MGLLDDAKKAIGMGQAKQVAKKPTPKPKKHPKKLLQKQANPGLMC